MVVALLVLAAFFLFRSTPSNMTNVNQTTGQNTNQQLNSNITTADFNTNSAPVISNTNAPPLNINTIPVNTAAPALLAYPIDKFQQRATANFFGTYYPVGGHDHPDLKVCPTAKYYSGYHTGMDLETFSTELNTSVPVFAIADGIVRQAGPVTGYGTLVVIGFSLKGDDYTTYYGHINGSTVTVKAGDAVTQGEKIAELGPACSSANGDVRKHLHFGLHKGAGIDVRGYVPDKTTLDNWVDSATFFSANGL